MRNILFTLFILTGFMVVSQIPRNNITSNDDILIQTIKPNSLPNANARGYLEYLPPNYDDHNEKLPLIIFLHGQGERGNGNSDLYKVAHLGIPNFIEDNMNLCYDVDGVEKCFIVISPQLSTSVNSWGAGVVNAVMDFARLKYRVDSTRIYLAGHSLGGIGVYKYASVADNNYRHKLAAIVPVAANGISTDEQGCRISARKINVRAYHSRADQSNVKFAGGEASFNRIKNCKNPIPTADLQFVAYDDLSHNATPQQAFSPTDTFNGLNVYEWLLSHTLEDSPDPISNQPPTASIGADLNIQLPLDSVVIDGSYTDPDGNVTTLEWSQIDGPSLTLTGIDSDDLILTDLIEGSFTFVFEVTDEGGLADSDTVSVKILGEASPQVGHLSEKVTDQRSVPYIEYLPYDFNPALNYPVLIYLSSENTEGDSLGLLYQEGPLFHITQEDKNFCFNVDGVDQCFIVITPQTEVGGGFYRGKVNALLDQIERDYNVSDIYLTGFDEGAAAIYARMLDPENNPNRYAAIAIVGARASSLSNVAQNIGQLDPKILIGHSDIDEKYSYTDVLNLYSDITSNTVSERTHFITYSGLNHSQSLMSAFDPESPTSIYSWLFTNSMGARTVASRSYEVNSSESGSKSLSIDYLFDHNQSRNLFRTLPVENGQVIIHNLLGQRIIQSSTIEITSKLQNLQHGVYLYHYVNKETRDLLQYGRILIR